MSCGAAPPEIPADANFLTGPVSVTLPTPSGDVVLEYLDGEWAVSGSAASKEAARLERANRALQQENAELRAKLERAARMTTLLQLDLKKAVLAKKISIKFASPADYEDFVGGR